MLGLAGEMAIEDSVGPVPVPPPLTVIAAELPKLPE
jgi:hypothetical protein